MCWTSFTSGEECNVGSGVTADILKCISISYEQVDKKLNREYIALSSKIDPPHKGLLVEGERAWARYKNAYCAAVFDSIFPGEEAGIEKESCLVSMASSRLMELIYIDTGVHNGGFFNALALNAKVSSKTRDEILKQIIEQKARPEESLYFEKNCKLTGILYKEEVRMCHARMRFRDM
jgi:uncharacterized protein YecT (DUF1311 family)